WWFGVARVFYVSVVSTYILFVTHAELTWKAIRSGDVAVREPTELLLAQQLAVGLALLSALAVGYVFRRRISPLAGRFRGRRPPRSTITVGIEPRSDGVLSV
ncbi:MAG TPA: hypothetical protein VGO64_09850, partial [Candidatus Limnocylindrales bacterium]|nr:hypothetical protein [Candidatus Limnocylindrales bacterium]